MLILVMTALPWTGHGVAQTAEEERGARLTIGHDSVLEVAFQGASYAIGWTGHGRAGTAVAGEDEKLLIFHLRLENAGADELAFDASALSIRAVDESGVVHDWPSTMHLRSAGPGALDVAAQRIFRSTLLPVRPLHVYSAIPVPAGLRLTELLVGYAGSDESLTFELGEQVGSLPEGLSALPHSVRRKIDAGIGDWLAGTSLDVRIDGVEVSSEPLGNREPGDEQQWTLISVSVRNRSVAEQGLSPATFRHTRLLTATGAELPVRLLLYPERPLDWRPDVAPGGGTRFRLVFRTPAGADAARLHLRVVGNEGRQSHLYDVDLGGGRRFAVRGPHAPGVFAPGAYQVEAIVPGETLVADDAGREQTAAMEALREPTGVESDPITAADPPSFPGAEPAAVEHPGSSLPTRPGSGIRVMAGEANVLYIGVDNELTVEAPGTDPAELRLEYPAATFLPLGAGRYTVTVARPGTAELRIHRGGQLLGSRELVTRRIPDPSVRLGRHDPDARLPVADFKAQGGVIALLDDFPFDAKCQVTGFELTRIPESGRAIALLNAGGRYSGDARKLIDAATRGDVYLFTNVRTKCPGDSASRRANPLVIFIR